MRHDRSPFDRVVQFSDGVVAIAITLLVLPLTEINAGEYDGDLGDLVSDNSDRLLAFAISFAVITLFWLAHHRVFARLKAIDSTITMINMVWLACIVFLPFPTALMEEGSSSSFVSFYIACLLVTSLVLKWLSMVIERRPQLWAEPSNAVTREGSVRGWLISAGFALAFLMSFLSPALGLYSLLVLILVDPIANVVSRRAERGEPVTR